MSGKIKGNTIELGMRCDALAKEITLTDTATLLGIKNSLERLLDILENTIIDLDLLEDRTKMKKNETSRILS